MPLRTWSKFLVASKPDYDRPPTQHSKSGVADIRYEKLNLQI